MIDREQVTIKRNILYLKNNGYGIHNYRALLFNYWVIIDKLMSYDSFTNTYMIPEININTITKPESINRAFRKLVEDKKIILEVREVQNRQTKQEEYRKHFGRGDK